ncbi:hypothetical protein SLOPH_626, partial [Spraguea lophii 42_110]
IQHWQLRDMLKTTNDGIIYCSNNKVCKLILDDSNIYDTCVSMYESDIYNNIYNDICGNNMYNTTNTHTNNHISNYTNTNTTSNHINNYTNTNNNHTNIINNNYNIVVIMEDLPFYPTTIDVCTIGNDNIIVVAGHNGYFAIKTKDRVIIERIGDTIINSVRILILDCNKNYKDDDRGDNGISDSDRSYKGRNDRSIGNNNHTTTRTNNHTKHTTTRTNNHTKHNNTNHTNTLVLFSSNDTTIKIYSIEYNTIIQSLEHQWPVNNCEYNKDKDILVTVGDTDEINIFKRNKNICCLECYKYDRCDSKSVIDSNNDSNRCDRCDIYNHSNDNNITITNNHIHTNHNNTNNNNNQNIKDIYEYYTTIKTYKDASFKISFNNNYIFSVSTQDGYVVVYDIRNIIDNYNDNNDSNERGGSSDSDEDNTITNNNTTNNTTNNSITTNHNITTNNIINNIILHSVQNNTIRGAIRNVLFINYKSLDLMVYTEHNTYFTIVDCRTFKYKQIIDITDNSRCDRYDRYDNSNMYDNSNRYDSNTNTNTTNTNNYNNININDRYDNNGKNKSKQISGLTYFKDRIFVSTEDSIYEYIINNKYRRLF